MFSCHESKFDTARFAAADCLLPHSPPPLLCEREEGGGREREINHKQSSKTKCPPVAVELQ